MDGLAAILMVLALLIGILGVRTARQEGRRRRLRDGERMPARLQGEVGRGRLRMRPDCGGETTR